MIVYDEYLINLHDFIQYHVNLYYVEIVLVSLSLLC